MCERVMIHNPKIDSKLEFEGPDTAEERERCARGASMANGQAWWPRVEAVCHKARAPLCPCVAHAPLVARGDVGARDWSVFLPLFHLF